MISKKIISKDHIIVILTIFCLTLFGLCFSCVFRCFRKLKADHNVYQARRSRSREDRLDVFDDASSRAHYKERARGANRMAGSQVATSKSDDPEDVFQIGSRKDTSTSRSQSIPTLPNGLLDSYASVERPPVASGVVINEGHYPARIVGLVAESSGRDSDEDHDDGDDEDEDDEEVEMVDHACQTRESLFDQNAPPPLATDAGRNQRAIMPRPHYPAPPSSSVTIPGAPPSLDSSRFKAERTIEIAQSPLPPVAPSGTRSRLVKAASSSVASSKSGPDIVILH